MKRRWIFLRADCQRQVPRDIKFLHRQPPNEAAEPRVRLERRPDAVAELHRAFVPSLALFLYSARHFDPSGHRGRGAAGRGAACCNLARKRYWQRPSTLSATTASLERCASQRSAWSVLERGAEGLGAISKSHPAAALW
mmetsp:Transcript_12230/g.37707  ORF Transcript_12230/g.37707 Transcript_12230/m.37707 type:complete len:139 (+) Transcript_12230:540-956(+)